MAAARSASLKLVTAAAASCCSISFLCGHPLLLCPIFVHKEHMILESSAFSTLDRYLILLLFGAKGAARDVADWTLIIVKWVFIIGAVILIGVMNTLLVWAN